MLRVFHRAFPSWVQRVQDFEAGNEGYHFSQHAAFAFAQGWCALKFEWYKYASWISFIKDMYVLISCGFHQKNKYK